MSNTGNAELATGVLSHLSVELGALKEIISRVADELGLPTENGNRAQDVLFWLDSPKTDESPSFKIKQALQKAEVEIDKWNKARKLTFEQLNTQIGVIA